MSDINIKTEKDLMRFLKIVAQESYDKSINESYLEYPERYVRDEDRFGKLSASSKKKLDEEEEDDASLFAEPEEDELQSEPRAVPRERPIEDEEGAKTTASLETVIRRINSLRAGRSTRDKEIKIELENYYNELEDNERELLVLYLNSISEILGGDVEGVEAKEPSDPPEKYKITSGEDAVDQEVAADVERIAPSAEDPAVPQDEEEKEDTSPPEDLPIKMAENKKSDWDLREKIRELMER